MVVVRRNRGLNVGIFKVKIGGGPGENVKIGVF